MCGLSPHTNHPEVQLWQACTASELFLRARTFMAKQMLPIRMPCRSQVTPALVLVSTANGFDPFQRKGHICRRRLLCLSFKLKTVFCGACFSISHALVLEPTCESGSALILDTHCRSLYKRSRHAERTPDPERHGNRIPITAMRERTRSPRRLAVKKYGMVLLLSFCQEKQATSNTDDTEPD